jgi:hypothetical protein
VVGWFALSVVATGRTSRGDNRAFQRLRRARHLSIFSMTFKLRSTTSLRVRKTTRTILRKFANAATTVVPTKKLPKSRPIKTSPHFPRPLVGKSLLQRASPFLAMLPAPQKGSITQLRGSSFTPTQLEPNAGIATCTVDEARLSLYMRRLSQGFRLPTPQSNES